MKNQLFILILSALVLVNSAFAQTDSIVYFPNKGQNANAIGKSFTKNDAYRAKNNQEFDNSDKRIKLFNQERIRLGANETKLWKYLNYTDKKVSLKPQDIELEKILREAVKNSEYIYVAKFQGSVRVRLPDFSIGRHGEKFYDYTISNRVSVEKNLKGNTKKLMKVRDDEFKFKKGAKYLIFADTYNRLNRAVKLNVSSEELEIVERILSENK